MIDGSKRHPPPELVIDGVETDMINVSKRLKTDVLELEPMDGVESNELELEPVDVIELDMTEPVDEVEENLDESDSDEQSDSPPWISEEESEEYTGIRPPLNVFRCIEREDFLATHPDPYNITISIPNHFKYPNIEAQVLPLQVKATDNCRKLKKRILSMIGLPKDSPLKLSAKVGYMHESHTLATFNIDNGDRIFASFRRGYT